MNIIAITIIIEDRIITVNIIPKHKVKANVRLLRIIRFNDLKVHYFDISRNRTKAV
jgi:hypothetical protein